MTVSEEGASSALGARSATGSKAGSTSPAYRAVNTAAPGKYNAASPAQVTFSLLSPKTYVRHLSQSWTVCRLLQATGYCQIRLWQADAIQAILQRDGRGGLHRHCKKHRQSSDTPSLAGWPPVMLSEPARLGYCAGAGQRLWKLLPTAVVSRAAVDPFACLEDRGEPSACLQPCLSDFQVSPF